MYPLVHDHEKQAGDQHHPAPFPASGHPNTSHSPQPYAPPYIASGVRAHAVPGKWSTGLCHCCDDPANCLITCICPCITFGQIADVVSRGSSRKPIENNLLSDYCKEDERRKNCFP
ncbi:cell number regulator 9-like [Alnus glutinosa]|uniref:cell number regulator 9-like n=1 Tax=Alnus glutinosa TaxID=3517 RepID=UPI002D79A7A1|nr:cell number regulator 9-like [Alnus glutinosa]